MSAHTHCIRERPGQPGVMRRTRRMQAVQAWMSGPILPREKTIDALESVIVSRDRIVTEGDNQKQADFLSRSLVRVPARRRRRSTTTSSRIALSVLGWENIGRLRSAISFARVLQLTGSLDRKTTHCRCICYPLPPSDACERDLTRSAA
jgi:hypothetical protein